MKKILTILLFVYCSFSLVMAQNFNFISIYNHNSPGGAKSEHLFLIPSVDVGKRTLLQNISGPKVHLNHDATIVVDIQVNSDGNVIYASIDTQKSSDNEVDLANQCLANARTLLFNKLDSSVPVEHGTISYEYFYQKMEFFKGHVDDIPCVLSIKGLNKLSLENLAVVLLPHTMNFDLIHELYANIKYRLSRNKNFVPIQNDETHKLLRYYDQDFENSYRESEWLKLSSQLSYIRMIDYKYEIANRQVGTLTISLSNKEIAYKHDYDLSIIFEADPNLKEIEYETIINDLKDLFNTNDIYDFHLKFLGIPLSGHISDFSKKLEEKGYTASMFYRNISRIFKGVFFDHKCDIQVFFYPGNRNVYAVNVMFPKMYNLDKLRDLYLDLKTGLMMKYSMEDCNINEAAFLNTDSYANLLKEIQQCDFSTMNLCDFAYGIHQGEINLNIMASDTNLFLSLFYSDNASVEQHNKNYYSDL